MAEDAELEDVVGLMESKHIKRVPVLRGNKVVGIVTRQNLVRALVGSTPAKPTISSEDDTIREQLLAQLSKQTWAPLMLNVIVTNGNVKLVGTIYDGRQRDALLALTENVPGVKNIEDELVWIEPMSGMVIESTAA